MPFAAAIVLFLLMRGGYSYSGKKAATSSEFNIINYDEKTGTLTYICPRCKGCGSFEDYTSCCTGINYYERSCPTCKTNKFLKIELDSETRDSIKEQYEAELKKIKSSPTA
ncbi:transcription initiation factor iiE [Caudoviricetes sp.]|nr:transcription initiation factor iiE [Caudoviricetes sp.]UOF81008.1 transcription initiation factor iiE [Caudoviricetes sp.]UOF81404.1 transcription initiation factor iiE [Caudoviricetes sp.]